MYQYVNLKSLTLKKIKKKHFSWMSSYTFPIAMANQNLFSTPHTVLKHRFPSNPVLTGFCAGSGAQGYAPLATAQDTIRMCRAVLALPASRTLTEQVVS